MKKSDNLGLLLTIVAVVEAIYAAGIATGENPREVPASQARRLLDDVKIFRSLDAEEKDRLSQQLVAQPFAAGQVVLEFGAASDQLWVIGTGVVSASIPDGDGFVEAGNPVRLRRRADHAAAVGSLEDDVAAGVVAVVVRVQDIMQLKVGLLDRVAHAVRLGRVDHGDGAVLPAQQVGVIVFQQRDDAHVHGRTLAFLRPCRNRFFSV